MRSIFKYILILGVIASGTGYSVLADPQREQKLDFEDELVEGLNKKPYDSVAQISDKDRKKNGSHLYWKRVHFQQENNAALREMRFIQ